MDAPFMGRLRCLLAISSQAACQIPGAAGKSLIFLAFRQSAGTGAAKRQLEAAHENCKNRVQSGGMPKF